MRRHLPPRPQGCGRDKYAPRNGAIIRGLVNGCWCLFKWGLALLVVAALAGGFYIYHRVDEELRLRILDKIAVQYPQLKVNLRYAQLVQGKGIELRGLSICEPGASGPQSELASIEEIFLSCNTDLQQLVQGAPCVTHVKMRRPTLRATRRADGSWSIARLLPLPRFSESTPEGTIENATLEVFDPLKTPATTLTLRDIHLKFKPHGPRGTTERQPLDIQGSLSADHMQRIELAGVVDPDRGKWDMAGKILGMAISPELRAALPAFMADKLTTLGSFRSEAELTFKLRSVPDQPIEFDVCGILSRGRIDDPRLPNPLSDLRANFRLTNTWLAVTDLTARNGQTTLSLSCRREGYASDSPLRLEASVTRMRIERQLIDALPPTLRDQYYNYLPDGEIDADMNLDFDGHTWTPEVNVRCQNVSFTCSKFQYRLEQGAGVISLRDNVLVAHLTAYTGSQPVRIDAEIHNPGLHFTGSWDIAGEHIPFDEKLFSALNGKAADVVRSLNPQGHFTINSRAWRETPTGEIHQEAQLSLNRCSMNYDRFTYPISNIRGTMEVIDGQWTFRNLEGTKGTAIITCSGKLTTGTDGELSLDLTGDNLTLDEELYEALPPSMQKVWLSLRPRGDFDMPQCNVRFRPEWRRPSITLSAKPRLGTASIEPVFFDYRMEKLRGAIYYRDGHADLKGLEAVHGRTTLAANGACDFTDDGAWTLKLANVWVDGLRADRDLLTAMPEGLRRAISELKPAGSVNLRGRVDFSKAGEPTSPLKTAWDIKLDMQQAMVDCGVKLENLCGSMRLIGESEDGRVRSRGDIALDSLTYKNFQVTEVLGPMWFDNGRVLFGAWAEPKASAGKLPRRLTGKIFGGLLMGDCQITLGPQPKYMIAASVSDANLSQFARENLTGRQKLNGKVAANVQFQGEAGGLHTLGGRGNVRLTDADIYELPFMVSLLSILSVRPPDTTAFTTSDIDFQIQGEQIIFDRINFNGDAISLLGQGWMKLDREIALTFHSIVGRAEYQIPILHNMFSEASSQILQIRVSGTLDKPEMHRKALPYVDQALKDLQAEFQSTRPARAPQSSGRAAPPRR